MVKGAVLFFSSSGFPWWLLGSLVFGTVSGATPSTVLVVFVGVVEFVARAISHRFALLVFLVFPVVRLHSPAFCPSLESLAPVSS